MKEFLKKFYRAILYKFFNLLYGKILYSDVNHTNQKIEIKKINDEEICKKDNSKYLVAKINDGRVCTDYVENVAIINDNQIVNTFSYQQVNGKLKSTKFNSMIYKGTPYFKKKFTGKVLSLTQGASGHKNYFHWLFDILPKIKLFSELYNLNNLNYFYLSKLENYQKITLECLGLSKIQIIDSNKYRHIQADELFISEHPWYYQGTILEQAHNLPSWIIKWIASTFLKHAKSFDCSEKVYIDRSESPFEHCQIQNNLEIINYLESKGFKSYKTGELPFLNQVYLFNNAKQIVGAHGAAFANLVFCKKDTKIVEIKPTNRPNLVSRTISETQNLNFNLIETEVLPENKKKDGDIILNKNLLDKYL